MQVARAQKHASEKNKGHGTECPAQDRIRLQQDGRSQWNQHRQGKSTEGCEDGSQGRDRARHHARDDQAGEQASAVGRMPNKQNRSHGPGGGRQRHAGHIALAPRRRGGRIRVGRQEAACQQISSCRDGYQNPPPR